MGMLNSSKNPISNYLPHKKCGLFKSHLKLFSNMYKYRFKNFIESETLKNKLNKKVIKSVSLKNLEPLWLLLFRINSLKYFNNIIYYSAPIKFRNLTLAYKNSSYQKSINKEKYNTAVDVVLDSISINSSYYKELCKYGIIFTNFSNSIKDYPDLVSYFIGSIISTRDNYYACLNSSTFSEGSFIFIPKNIKCPIDLSTYFRINGSVVGQFERTLIIAESYSSVSYLEGCTAPVFNINQLHVAVVELIAFSSASLKYSTVQNWYYGDSNGNGGVYNLVTKRGLCYGENSKISWTQVETGSLFTWKY